MKQVFSKASFAQLFCLIVAVLCILLTFACIIIFVKNPSILKDSAATAMLTVAVGVFAGGATGSIRFITGSNAGSQAKDEAQKEVTTGLVKQLGASTPAPTSAPVISDPTTK